MRGITLGYVARRLMIFVLTVWISATIIFFIPRFSPGDPVSAMVSRMESQSGPVRDGATIVAGWRARFGLDRPLMEQYVSYMVNVARFDFGYSLARFPAEVSSIIGQALPWTVGLVGVATILSCLIGSAIGALLAWKTTPRLLKMLLPLSMIFTAIPFLMMAMVLIFVFVFQLRWFPMIGAYSRNVTPGLNLPFILSVVHYGLLPALSIILSSMGFWAMGMRGMVITVDGEDYMALARAKGLQPVRVFWRYGIRNAMLPQITALALAIGGIVGGNILIEYIFGYPGLGGALHQAIINSDYTLMQGIVMLLIIITALAVLLLDLIYPLLDPRISYKRGAS